MALIRMFIISGVAVSDSKTELVQPQTIGEPCKKTTVSKKLLLSFKRSTVFTIMSKNLLLSVKKTMGLFIIVANKLRLCVKKNYCLVSKKLCYSVKRSTFVLGRQKVVYTFIQVYN